MPPYSQNTGVANSYSYCLHAMLVNCYIVSLKKYQSFNSSAKRLEVSYGREDLIVCFKSLSDLLRGQKCQAQHLCIV